MSQLSLFTPSSDPYCSAIQALNNVLPEHPELLARVTGLLLEASRLREELSEEIKLSRQMASRLLEYHDREQKRENVSCLPLRSTRRATIIPFRKEGSHA